MDWWGKALLCIAAYLIGSVNFAIIFSRLKGTDITKKGSGNPGTTNMLRSFGFGYGALTFALDALKNPPKRGKLILVSAITPTPAGEGKTTTSIGLAQGLRKIGKNAALALRQPSMGPVFGRKGGIFPELASCGYVSGTHGELKFFPNEDCWGIRDCGSTNGTFLNGTRLERDKWYILKAGNRLRIATLDFNVE